MGQIAYSAATGERLEAFSVSDDTWSELTQAPKGSLLMPRTNWPAMAKTSLRGLRFFSHYSGYPGQLPAPESYAHTRLKVDIVKALRALGYEADIEVYGKDTEGAEWIADVLATGPDGSRTAFEVQLSSQHLDDFLRRTERYTRSGVRVCWIMSEKPVSLRLAKAIHHRNPDYHTRTGRFLGDSEFIIPLSLAIEDKNAYPDPLPLLRFGRGKLHQRLNLSEAVDGVMRGFPRWSEPDWIWDISSGLRNA